MCLTRHRLFKEHKLYRNEAEGNQRKVDRIVAENGEEWEIKNAVRVLTSLRHTPTLLLLRAMRVGVGVGTARK